MGQRGQDTSLLLLSSEWDNEAKTALSSSIPAQKVGESLLPSFPVSLFDSSENPSFRQFCLFSSVLTLYMPPEQDFLLLYFPFHCSILSSDHSILPHESSGLSCFRSETVLRISEVSRHCPSMRFPLNVEKTTGNTTFADLRTQRISGKSGYSQRFSRKSRLTRLCFLGTFHFPDRSDTFRTEVRKGEKVSLSRPGSLHAIYAAGNLHLFVSNSHEDLTQN